MLSRSTALRATNALQAMTDGLSVLKPPHGFVFNYQPGSRLFTLCTPSEATPRVVVSCVVSPKKRGQLRHGQRRGRVPRRVRPQLPFETTNYTRFSCCISGATQGSSLELEVRCRSLLGQIVIDGITLGEDVVTAAEGPEQCYSQLSYQGPYVSQSHLAELIVNSLPTSSPLWSPRQATSAPFDADLNYASSPFSRFGHAPVHTLNPTLAGKAAKLLEGLGVDDELASFVEETSEKVRREEEDAWTALSRASFCSQAR